MTTKRNSIAVLFLISTLAILPGVYAQQFSDWQAATHVGSPVSSGGTETGASLSKDGLSLYFACNGCGGYGGNDLFVAQRASIDDPWGAPQNLGPNINTADNDTGPAVSLDGHRLYFTRDGTGGFGQTDIYVSRRHNKRDDFGWQLPENLGEGVNTSDNEAQASVFEDDLTGVITLYFSSNRPGLGGTDVYASTMQADESFGPAVLVEELSSSKDDNFGTISRDGLEMFLTSNRVGSLLNLQNLPSYDLWTSTRASTDDPWPTPVSVDPLGANYINTRRHEGSPELSFDGTTLYFQAAQRPENIGVGCSTYAATCFFDVWVVTREKLQGPE